MSISTTPPAAPPKKKKMGCLGCGCLILALLVILVVGLIAGGGYFLYRDLVTLTSPAPATIPSFNGSDDIYNAARQKLKAFVHDVDNHQAAKIELNGDEINTLMARDPYFNAHQIHLFVTLTSDQAQLQGSVFTDNLDWAPKGRYLNFRTTFSLAFNADAKNLGLILHDLQIHNQTTPDNLLPFWQTELTVFLNLTLQKQPEAVKVLDQAKTIEIKDGELVIETR
jgi:hypothetical protein